MDHVRQSNSQKIVDKGRREGTSNRKTWIDDEESDVVCWKGIVHELLSIKQLIPNSTVNNWKYYNKQLRESGQN